MDLEVEIISPQGIVFDGICHVAVVPSIDGDIGVMHNHESFIAKLQKGEIRIFKDSSKDQSYTFPVENGFAEIKSQGKLLVLID